jgi:ProP effector
MKNKWNSKQVREAQQWLTATWPQLFENGRDLKPLSLKIHKEILQQPGRPETVSRRALMEALKRHVNSFGYLYGLIKATHRHNLQGEQEELISPAHKQWAKMTLRRAQKLSQATSRRSARNRQVAAPHSRAMASIADRPARTRTVQKRIPSTQITYKKSRRRVIQKSVITSPPVAA